MGLHGHLSTCRRVLGVLIVLLLKQSFVVSFHPSFSTITFDHHCQENTRTVLYSTSRTAREARVNGEINGEAKISSTDCKGDEKENAALPWYGAPKFELKPVHIPRQFRQQVRKGAFTGPTNSCCPGFLQCNLVVLPQKEAFDFLVFCQRNRKACPLIEACEVGSPCPVGVAPGADLRTDIPMYSIYKDGEWVEDRTDVIDIWPEDSVAFLIGCSFTYDGALADAGIPLRSAEQGKSVPIYKTNLKCRPAGALHGNIAVSMKPIPTLQLSKHVEITSKYTHAHGGPICIGQPQEIGIKGLSKPDWGEPVELQADEVPVFHACGVTPQDVLMESKVSFAITHKAGHMFITDMPSDMDVV